MTTARHACAGSTTTFQTNAYRPDIDGLRAVAVLIVILTHVGVPGFAGGFIGVDVFFVISGYLIYRDLVSRLNDGRLSLLGFYRRRMWRTLPALYVVCAFTLAGALVLAMPAALTELARSTMAALLLVPNIFYMTKSGYFTDATGKPLLHTWSLGVEEQFYLVAPLLPLALRGLTTSRRKLAIIALFGACLALAIGVRLAISRDAAFFLMPSRAFEFLIGCLLAENIVPAIRRRWAAEALTLTALVALAVATMTFSAATPLPGLLSLVPCFATTAIIHVGTTRNTLVGAALGLRGPAFIGLISYSLYLWHWPLIVAARYLDWSMTTPPHALSGAVLLCGLSIVSWRFVETPFRNPQSRGRAWAPILVPSAAAGLVCACLALIAAAGFPSRYPSDVVSVESYTSYLDQKPYREGQCFMTSQSRHADFDRATCLGIVPGKTNVLLIGDSHAAQLWTGLAETWPQINFLQATASGCKPLLGTTGPKSCMDFKDEFLDRFVSSHRLDAVAIAGLWDASDIAPLQATIARLQPHARNIIVFGPVPRYDVPFAALLAKSLLRGKLDEVPKYLHAGTKALDADMRVKIGSMATYVSSWQTMCPRDECRLLASPGVPMQFDFNHLTGPGAAWMIAAIRATHPSLFGPQTSPVNQNAREPGTVAKLRDNRPQ